MNIDFIFTEEYTPRQRRALLMKEYIRHGLTLFGGNRKQTASFLGISPRTLRIFMADNPELREEFPANVFTEHKYNPVPKTNHDDLSKSRLYKSLLKYQYKINKNLFNSIQEIANHYNITIHEADLWVKNKVTSDNTMVRMISTPVNWDGSEVEL